MLICSLVWHPIIIQLHMMKHRCIKLISEPLIHLIFRWNCTRNDKSVFNLTTNTKSPSDMLSVTSCLLTHEVGPQAPKHSCFMESLVRVQTLVATVLLKHVPHLQFPSPRFQFGHLSSFAYTLFLFPDASHLKLGTLFWIHRPPPGQAGQRLSLYEVCNSIVTLTI